LFHPQSSSHLVVFVLVFLDYVFLSVDNIRDAWELFVMAYSVDIPAAKRSFCCYLFTVYLTTLPVVEDARHMMG
jgi:hypothetical protein